MAKTDKKSSSRKFQIEVFDELNCSIVTGKILKSEVIAWVSWLFDQPHSYTCTVYNLDTHSSVMCKSLNSLIEWFDDQ